MNDFFKMIKPYCNATILGYFENPQIIANEPITPNEKWEQAKNTIDALMKTFIPCYNEKQHELIPYWANLFNYTFINHSNETNEKQIQYIQEKYQDTIIQLQRLNDTGYCYKQKLNNKDYGKTILSVRKMKNTPNINIF